MQTQSMKVTDNSYSTVLELTEVTNAPKTKCHMKCMQTWGCVFYNYNKKLSACHFADPLGGSNHEKPDDLTGWSIWKIEKLTIDGHDEF